MSLFKWLTDLFRFDNTQVVHRRAVSYKRYSKNAWSYRCRGKDTPATQLMIRLLKV